MKKRAQICSVFVIAWSVASLCSAQIISSTFNSDTDGWGCMGDGWLTRDASSQSLMGHDMADGRWWHYVAPPKFLGNRVRSFGGTLSYTLRPMAADPGLDSEPDVTLQGDGIVLVTKVGQFVGGVSRSISVSLDTATAWHVDDVQIGVLATGDQIRHCLGHLNGLYIRGEFSSGNYEVAYLDDVVLTAQAGCTLNGFITLDGSVQTWLPIGRLEMRQAGTTTVVHSCVLWPGADGSYDVEDLPAGTFDLAYEFQGALRVVLPSQTLIAGTQCTLDVHLEVGDADNSNLIDIFDLNLIFTRFGRVGDH